MSLLRYQVLKDNLAIIRTDRLEEFNEKVEAKTPSGRTSLLKKFDRILGEEMMINEQRWLKHALGYSLMTDEKETNLARDDRWNVAKYVCVWKEGVRIRKDIDGSSMAEMMIPFGTVITVKRFCYNKFGEQMIEHEETTHRGYSIVNRLMETYLFPLEPTYHLRRVTWHGGIKVRPNVVTDDYIFIATKDTIFIQLEEVTTSEGRWIRHPQGWSMICKGNHPNPEMYLYLVGDYPIEKVTKMVSM